MEKTEIIIILDIGSSSIRCSAYFRNKDSSVNTISSSFRKRSSVYPNTGKVRLVGYESSSSLLECIDECLDETLKKIPAEVHGEFKIIGVGFSSFVMNLVGIDKNGCPVGEEATMSYACNNPDVTKQVDTLKSVLGEDRVRDIYEKTGAPIHSAYALPQMQTLYRNNKELCSKIHKWQTIASLSLSRWTNNINIPISYSEASWTGLLNYCSCDYESSVLDLLPEECRFALPELADFDDMSSQQIYIPANSAYATRWPELKEARFFLGVGDGACANIGSKCSTADRIACTVGTSAAARICLPHLIGVNHVRVVPGLFCYRIDKMHLLIGGALTDGGSAIEWVRRLLNLNDDETFAACMEKVYDLTKTGYLSSDNSPFLSIVPFLSGERSTGFRSGATGAIIGITRATTQEDIVKATLEGVVLRLDAIIKLILQVSTGTNIPVIIASGQALEANSLWRQMLADCSGLEVVFDAETTEGTSRGAAYLASISLGAEKEEDGSLGRENISSTVVASPNYASASYWKRLKEFQNKFIDAVSPLYNQSS